MRALLTLWLFESETPEAGLDMRVFLHILRRSNAASGGLDPSNVPQSMRFWLVPRPLSSAVRLALRALLDRTNRLRPFNAEDQAFINAEEKVLVAFA